MFALDSKTANICQKSLEEMINDSTGIKGIKVVLGDQAR